MRKIPRRGNEFFVPKKIVAPLNRHVRFTPKSGRVQCTSACLLWANSGHDDTNRKTASRRSGMSAKGQERTSQRLIDYFIGTAEQRRRHGETEHSGGLRIDDQLELGRFDNWQFGRLGALKDAASIATALTK